MPSAWVKRDDYLVVTISAKHDAEDMLIVESFLCNGWLEIDLNLIWRADYVDHLFFSNPKTVASQYLKLLTRVIGKSDGHYV